MQFKIFKKKNIIQTISPASFDSMKGREKNKRAVKFLKSLGYKTNVKSLIWAEQVFDSKVHICKIGDSGKTIKGVDGLISNNRNQILAIVSADCLPILLYDPRQEVVAALHGARKSLLKGIVKKAIRKMIEGFASQPSEILVGIGPHIRKCHYWLREKTYQSLKKTKYRKYLINTTVIKKPRQCYYSKKVYFDLTKLVFDELLESGLKKKNIEDSKICTFCSAKKYFSQRKKEQIPNFYKEEKPRFATFIGLPGNRLLKISPENFAHRRSPFGLAHYSALILRSNPLAKHSFPPPPEEGVVRGYSSSALRELNNVSSLGYFKLLGRAKLERACIGIIQIPIQQEIIKIATEYLKKGKVLVCPTDTVYGLLADATNKSAVERLFKIKKRKRNKFIPIFVKDLKAARKLAYIDEKQEKFLKKVWPGKVTAVLKRKPGYKVYGVDKKTIGLRMPNHRLLLNLVKQINCPLTGTSANISGKPASTKIKEVLKQFTLRRDSGQEKYQPDLVISAGNLPKSKPSKVIDLTKKPPKILRE